MPPIIRSPLENDVQLNDKILKDILKNEGIKSYRICKLINNLKGKIEVTYKITSLFMVAILVGVVLGHFQVIPQLLANIIIALSAGLNIVSILLQWIRPRRKQKS
jgi:F0F1-type ATP synthase assembly protein I